MEHKNYPLTVMVDSSFLVNINEFLLRISNNKALASNRDEIISHSILINLYLHEKIKLEEENE